MPENRRLVRVRDGRILAGVCTGLGRYTRIDPVIFRVALAVLALGAGGSGIFLYVAAALLMPSDEDAVSPAEQLFRRRFDGDTVLAVLGGLLTAGVAFSVVGRGLGAGGGATGPLTVVAVFGLALLVAHARGVDLVRVARTFPERFQGTPLRPDERRAAPAPDPAGMIDLATLGRSPLGAAEPGTTRSPVTKPLPPDAMPHDAVSSDALPTEPLPPRPEAWAEPTAPQEAPDAEPPEPGPRGRSRPAFLTLVTALGAGAATVPLTTHQSVTTRVTIAIAAGLGVLGAGLVVASWYGRGRGLVSLGVVLCLALVATSAVGELPSDGRWGDVHWRPISARTEQSYRVIIGEGDLDLTALPLGAGQRVRVRAEVSLGEMRVTVPGAVTTEVHARSSLGDVDVAGRVTSGPRARVDVVLPAEGGAAKDAPVIELFVRGRIGDVQVRRVSV
ncbi:MAG TPA: PspC domain-containing protein [Streptosporangiaceae bacterium]|nr:PspC domain-containing protein [Streptosporangiaceae bacterium]